MSFFTGPFLQASGSQVHFGGSEAFENRLHALPGLDEMQSGIRSSRHHLASIHAGGMTKIIDEVDGGQQRIARRMASDTSNQHAFVDLQAGVELREIELPPLLLCSTYDERAIGHAVGDALD